MPHPSCGVFRVGRGRPDLWALIPVTARRSEYFLIEAASGNSDVVSINGQFLRPGGRRLMIRDEILGASFRGPDPECRIEVFAVVEGQ
jgi:hypothetical protein